VFWFYTKYQPFKPFKPFIKRLIFRLKSKHKINKRKQPDRNNNEKVCITQKNHMTAPCEGAPKISIIFFIGQKRKKTSQNKNQNTSLHRVKIKEYPLIHQNFIWQPHIRVVHKSKIYFCLIKHQKIMRQPKIEHDRPKITITRHIFI
jgi:hypothetical protein